MKILILSEYFPKSDKVEIKGGIETRAYYFAKHLAKKHDVTVITSREKGMKKKDSFSGIKVIRSGRTREYVHSGKIMDRLSFMISAYKDGKKLDFDIVDGYNFISYPTAALLGKKKKSHSVATYHDVWINEWVKNIGIGGLLFEPVERWILSGRGKKWTHFITNSNCTKKELIDVGIPKQKITTVYSGVDLARFNKIKGEKFKEPTIIYVGRLVRYKRVDSLIKAIKEIKESIPNIQCKIIGTGPESNELSKLIKRLDLEKNVELMGFVEKYDDVIRTIKSSHVFCLPSEVEGLGLVSVETMACGVPYVSSKIPPTIEATDNGKGGLLYQVGNIHELKSKIIKLLEDKELYAKLSNEGKTLAKRYEWEKLAKQAEKVYASL